MKEDIKILENIKEYMQNQINKGYNKFIYNDLGWDEKCIDVINAIENLIARNKELKQWYELFNKTNPEKMKIIADSFHEKMADKFDKEFIPKSKVREKIEELLKEYNDKYTNRAKYKVSYAIKILQELLEEN